MADPLENLIPFRPGPDARRGKKGRPHSLDDPEFAKRVAEAFVAGLTRAEIADMFGIKDVDTITRWRRDPRIKAHAMKLIEDRILQVTRKVDSEIENRLKKPGDLTTRELIEIRKEFLGGALRQQHEKADDETVTQAVEAVENNPDLARQLRELLSRKAEPESDLPEPEREKEPVVALDQED